MRFTCLITTDSLPEDVFFHFDAISLEVAKEKARKKIQENSFVEIWGPDEKISRFVATDTFLMFCVFEHNEKESIPEDCHDVIPISKRILGE